MLRGKTVKEILSKIISDLDKGRTPQRPRLPGWVQAVALPAALGIGALGIGACDSGDSAEQDINKADAIQGKADGDDDYLCELLGEGPGCDFCDILGWTDDGVCDDFCEPPDPECAVALYAIPMEDCTDGVDNDGDLLADCCDTDCEGDEACYVACEALYGVPMPEDCRGDCIDNDCDDLIDCEDPDCARDCQIYPVLPFHEVCNDEIDNDDDGDVDCADPDCFVECGFYPVMPFHEVCDDEIDNDDDGDVDCADSDCFAECGFNPVLPFGEVCDDGIDNDGDGLIDCEDSDCVEEC